MLLVSLRGTGMWILLFQDRARLATSPCYLQSLCSAKLTANFFLNVQILWKVSFKLRWHCSELWDNYVGLCIKKKFTSPLWSLTPAQYSDKPHLPFLKCDYLMWQARLVTVIIKKLTAHTRNRGLSLKVHYVPVLNRKTVTANWARPNETPRQQQEDIKYDLHIING